MADDEAIERAVGVMALLRDRTRLRMVLVLAEGELTVGELQARLGVVQSLASFHLGVLRRAGLVRWRRRRHRHHSHRFYALDPAGWPAAVATLRDVLPPISPIDEPPA